MLLAGSALRNVAVKEGTITPTPWQLGPERRFGIECNSRADRQPGTKYNTDSDTTEPVPAETPVPGGTPVPTETPTPTRSPADRSGGHQKQYARSLSAGWLPAKTPTSKHRTIPSLHVPRATKMGHKRKSWSHDLGWIRRKRTQKKSKAKYWFGPNDKSAVRV